MPTYDYQCEKCGKIFELKQSMKEDAFTTCPKEHCQMETWGEGHVKRLLGTGAGLIFKGSGFYITDYRSENYKQGAKSESAASGGDKPATGGEKAAGGTGEKSAAAPTPAPVKTEAPKAPAPKPAAEK